MTDQELDQLLRQHAGAARDLMLSQLPPDDTLPDFPTSPGFERRMARLIRRTDRPAWAKAALRYAQQAAVIVLVCTALTFSGLMVTSQAFRAQVLSAISQFVVDLTEFRFSAQEETRQKAGAFTLSYLPEGMQEVRRSGNNTQLHIFFEDETGNTMRLTHSIINPNTAETLGLDTEDADVETFYIRGEQATAISKGLDRTILWTSGNSVYLLSGTIPMEELKLVALGLR